MTRSVKIEGLRELDAALGQLSKATARNTLRRVLLRAGQPIAEEAARLAPDDPKSGAPDLHTSIAVSTQLKNKVGASEFGEVLRSGGSRADAAKAMRDARRAAAGEGSFAEVYAGPSEGGAHGVLQEFGTRHHKAQPFMRPAWDKHQDTALDIIKKDLGAEIDKAAQRAARRAAKKAGG